MTDSAWNAYMYNKGIDAAIDELREELTEGQLIRLVNKKKRVTVTTLDLGRNTFQTVESDE